MNTLINDGHDGNETLKFYTEDISQMLSSPNIFSCTHCNYHHCFIFSVSELLEQIVKLEPLPEQHSWQWSILDSMKLQ